MRRIDPRAFLIGLAILAPAASARADYYAQANLVSDVPGMARTLDANLKNPWGVANAPGGPFWVSNAGSNTSTLYDGQGTKAALTVTVPGGPTGQIFNGNANDFKLTTGTGAGTSASFVFDTLGGGIYAWNGKAGTLASSEVSGTGAVYTGLATAQVGSDNVLFAADAKGNKVDVYGGAFQNLGAAGGSYFGKFVDPTLASGYSAFNVANVAGTLFVTYQNNADGSGVVDRFDLAGNFLGRFAGNGPAGPLLNPWGVVLAPSTFGQFGGDLLIGNNDAGTIGAYDPKTGAFLGTINGPDGKPLINTGLWAITFGNGARNSDPDTLYIFAGINGEQDGLIAAITPSAVPEPTSALMLGVGSVLALAGVRHRRKRSAA